MNLRKVALPKKDKAFVFGMNNKHSTIKNSILVFFLESLGIPPRIIFKYFRFLKQSFLNLEY